MNQIILLLTLFFPFLPINAQEKFPIVKTNSDLVSIKDGEILKKDTWKLAPHLKPDIYETTVRQGEKKRVIFITDLDSIGFDVEAGKKYAFIIQKGDTLCYTQIKVNLLEFWNDKNFWESPAMNTPFKPNLTNEEKIAGLSKFWSEAKYNFINFHLLPGLDWDKTYLEFIPKVLATKSTLEYYQVLQMFCAKLKDGHTSIYLPDELAEEVAARPAIQTRLVENKVIIIDIYDENLKKDGLTVGQEIVEIDSIPVKKYAEEKVSPFIGASTPQSLEAYVYGYFLFNGSISKLVELTIKDFKGNLLRRSLPRLRWQDLNKLVPQQPAFEMKMLPNNVAHVKINTMVDGGKADQIFAQRFSEISKADALVLDLRENMGGSSIIGYKILSFLIDTPFKQSKWLTREYHPAFRAWGRTEKAFGDANAFEYNLEAVKKLRGENTQPFLKPVVVLSSPRTFSAAEDFLVAFKPLKRGLIIGEPSGGSTGQPLVISLPGGGIARICSKRDTFPDGTDFVGIGVIPDVLTQPKFSDFIENKDSVLERALMELTRESN